MQMIRNILLICSVVWMPNYALAESKTSYPYLSGQYTFGGTEKFNAWQLSLGANVQASWNERSVTNLGVISEQRSLQYMSFGYSQEYGHTLSAFSTPVLQFESLAGEYAVPASVVYANGAAKPQGSWWSRNWWVPAAVVAGVGVTGIILEKALEKGTEDLFKPTPNDDNNNGNDNDNDNSNGGGLCTDNELVDNTGGCAVQ